MPHASSFDYAIAHTSPLADVLSRLERETHLKTLSPQMLSGPLQGQLLRFFSLMLRPRRVLEIGTFTGFSAICLAEGLTDDGLLHTIEADDELGHIIQKHIQLAGFQDKTRLHFGDAAQIVPMLDEVFDLVFLDAGKLDYAHHYELVLPKIRSGGFLLADNVLWDGKVLTPEKDATGRALHDFNRMVQADPQVENLLLPLRDGLLVARKI
jgi:caffeoyl-CoA O-methyltransferase